MHETAGRQQDKAETQFQTTFQPTQAGSQQKVKTVPASAVTDEEETTMNGESSAPDIHAVALGERDLFIRILHVKSRSPSSRA